MKQAKMIFLFIVFSLILFAVIQLPLVMLYLDEQQLLKQVKIETVNYKNQNFQKSKLDIDEKIELIHEYYNTDGLDTGIIMVSKQQNMSNFDSDGIKNKIQEQVTKLQKLNIFPTFNFDDFVISELIITTYSKVDNPEDYVSFLDVLLSDGDNAVKILIDQDNNLIYQFNYKGDKITNDSEKKSLEIFGLEYLGIPKKTLEKFYYCKIYTDQLMIRIY